MTYYRSRPSSTAAQLALVLLFGVIVAAAQKQEPATPVNVLTYRADNLRTGWFSSETQLTVAKVNTTSFGLLTSVPLDGRVDGEPLYVSQQMIQGKGVHNVVYVATENNSVYAIDAAKGTILWHKTFGTPVPYTYKNNDDNVYPVMGILSTPVIDLTLGNIYFVSDTYNGKTDAFTLHAISLSTGLATIKAVTIQVSATLSDGTTWKLNPKYHLQRPGLLEANGAIYVSFGSTGDTVPAQSRGVIVRYDASSLLQLGSDLENSLHVPANPYYLSSIWQSGYAPASDSNGDVYFSTGNSSPNQPSYSANFNRPQSVVHLSGDLSTLLDSFTPSNYFQLDQQDLDLGSGATILLPDQPGSIPHFAIAGGKDGRAFLLNRDSLGGYTQSGSDNVLQTVQQGACWCGPGYFTGADGNPYVLTGGGSGIISWQLQLTPTPQLVQKSATTFGIANGLPWYGGSIPVVSSNGTIAGTAIVWVLQKPQTSSDTNPGTPLTLLAFDASNLQKQIVSIQAGNWTHAIISNANLLPTVANGKVYVASNLQLNIFGLLPPKGTADYAALPHVTKPANPDVVTCSPAETPLAELGTSTSATHELYGKVCRIGQTEVQVSLRDGKSIVIDTTHATIRLRRATLVPGRTVHVIASIDQKGVAHASQMSPMHTSSLELPADR
ncbi:MAG TPA: hypothetical protein VIH89_00480 [Candidatus Sulfotelmatobacter sp.]